MKTKETSNKVTCNQCGKQKTGSIEGICEHCGRFGNFKSTRQLALDWWNELRSLTVAEGNGISGIKRSWDLVNKYFPEQIPSGKGIALLEGHQIEEIWRKETQDNGQAEVYIEHQERFETDVSYIQKAIVWWNKLSFESKFYKVIAWLKSQGKDTTERHPDTLTTDEVVKIWEKETQSNPDTIQMIQSIEDNFDIIAQDNKPNQKQFKQFDKELFKKYIDKFSDEDKIQALKIIAKELYSSDYSSGAFSDKVLINIGRLS